MHAVDDKNRLVTLSNAAPGAVARMAITGLQSGDEIVALDTRPATKQLYALGRSSRIYQLDPGSAVATAVGSGFNPALNGSAFGFDFNPTVPSSLYRIDLGTGAATLLGKIGGSSPLRGIAAGGFASVDTTAPVLDVRAATQLLDAGRDVRPVLGVGAKDASGNPQRSSGRA